MTFEEILDRAMALLERRRRVAYRTLKAQFDLDDDALEALKDELLYAQQVARDEDGRVLVWCGFPEGARASDLAASPTAPWRDQYDLAPPDVPASMCKEQGFAYYLACPP